MINRYNIFLIVLFWFFTTVLYGQNAKIDSLLNILPTLAQDTNRVNVLNDLSWKFHKIDTEQTLCYSNQALELAKAIQYPKGIGRALNLSAIFFSGQGDLNESIRLNEECLRIGDSIQSSFLQSVAINDLAIDFAEKGMFEKALTYFYKALQLGVQRKDTIRQIHILQNITVVQYTNGNEAKAESYACQVIDLGEQSKDPLVLVETYMYKAYVASNNQEFEQAAIHFEKAYYIAKKINDKTTMSEALIELGLISINFSLKESKLENNSTYKQRVKEEGITYMNESIIIAEEIGNRFFEIAIRTGVSKAYEKLKDWDKVIEINTKNLQILEEASFLELKVNVNKHLSKAYAEKKDFTNAYKHHKQYVLLKDSLFSKEKTKAMLEVEEKFQVKIKESENDLLKAQQKEQASTIQIHKRVNTYLGIILLLLSALGFMIYRIYSAQKKSHKLLEEKVKERTKELQLSNDYLKKSNKELEQFAYITSHDLKEPLRSINGFANLLSRELNVDDTSNAGEYISFIKDKTKQLNTLISDILTYTKLTENTKIEKDVDLNTVVQSIENELTYTLENKNISIELAKQLPCIESTDSKMFFLFKNIIENGLKYNQSKMPKVVINYKIKEKHYLFSIKDNGIGIDKKYQKQVFEMFKRLHDRDAYIGTGLGLALCKKITDDLKGDIWLESEVGKGSTFYFTLPKEVIMHPQACTKRDAQLLTA